MGPFQEYEEKKSPEKGSPRSRIPRLVLHPFRPKDRGSPGAESPASEEEGQDLTADPSKRTISTITSSSYSGSEQSPVGSPPPAPQRQPGVKRVRLMADRSAERAATARHQRRQRPVVKATKGSEADFSSSSSTRSLKSRESAILGLGGRKTPRSRTTRTRPLPVFKPAGSPVANRDSELFAPFQTPPRACASSSSTTTVTNTTTSSSSSNSSPTTRRMKLGRYHSCGDNHGIMAPHPEQYLTPLQQKEVNIRHLKTKLMESETIIHDREADIEELKSQLGRMREDWIEEECHRVEAQLSLKEARKEIRQLRQVVETMKCSLMEKDKGIQKYFIDINIQNRKLESLLQSMELAQSGSNLMDDQSMDFLCEVSDGGGKAKLEEEGGEALGDQAAEQMADSGLLLNDEMANRADILERVLMSTAVEFNQDTGYKLRPGEGPDVSTLLEEEKAVGKSASPAAVPKNPFSAADLSASGSTTPPTKAENKEMQTEMTPAAPDLQALLLQLLKLHGGMVGDATAVSQKGDADLLTPLSVPAHAAATTTTTATDLTDCMLSPFPTESPESWTDSGMCSAAEPVASTRFMEELDFGVCKGAPSVAPELGLESKRYWSKSFLVDLVAVAAPVLPTVAWLYSRHGVDGSAPVYNIAALIRGCCIMGLHSLRHVS